MLNGEVKLDQQYLPARMRSTAARRHDPRPKKSPSPEVVSAVRPQRSRKELEEKDPVTVSEAARMLHVPTSRLRELLDERKIYYTQDGSKRSIPKQALENFVNGLPAIAMLEENIAYYRANKKWDGEMEEAAAKLRSEWQCDPPRT
jgi:excisionase family DNA binding protein